MDNGIKKVDLIINMKTENIIVEKSFRFAVRIVKLCHHISNNKKEYIYQTIASVWDFGRGKYFRRRSRFFKKGLYPQTNNSIEGSKRNTLLDSLVQRN